MRVAFGMKSHSGWAALVVIAKQANGFVVVDRRRIELVKHARARQPYHAAEGLQPEAACELVTRGIDGAHESAVREMKAAIERESERKNEVIACGVLVGSPMPDWTVAEILAVHFRMHKAEGVLFREALIQAAKDCKLKAIEVPEKEIMAHAERRLKTSASDLSQKLAAMGKAAGAPWGKDQKDAALAAMVALATR